MVKGGSRTLERTRYLYTEYSNDEMYEGQATLQDMLDLLPQFGVLELWPDNVLLVNRNLQSL
jgi:2-O-methyltransferase